MKGRLRFFRTKTFGLHVGASASLALHYGLNAKPTIMAIELIDALVVGKTHIAVPALGYPATIGTFEIGSKTTSVLK